MKDLRPVKPTRLTVAVMAEQCRAMMGLTYENIAENPCYVPKDGGK